LDFHGFWHFAAWLKAWISPVPKISFPWREYEFVVASSAGLFLCSRTRNLHLLRGRYTAITFADGAMFVFELHRKRGRIRRIGRDGSCATVIDRLPPVRHLLDCWEGRLYAAGAERIRVFDLASWEETDLFGPVPLHGSACSLNGLLFRGGKTYVLCHNGAASTVIVGDRAFQPERTIALAARQAHNIAFLDERMLVCDSAGGRLIDVAGTLARFDGFVRGLAVTGDAIAVGVSNAADGRLVFLDHRFAMTGSLELPGAVEDVRALFRPDAGLSEKGSDEA
jgi:hypothetical protein